MKKETESKKELLSSMAVWAVNMVAICLPTIALSWVGSTICRMVLDGPTIAEYIILFVLCLAGQLGFGYFMFYKKGYDNRSDSIEYHKKVLKGSTAIHSVLSLVLSFPSLICGSAVTNLGQFVFLCFFPKTELPLIAAFVPSIFYFVSFALTECLFIIAIYYGIKNGKKKRREESESFLNQRSSSIDKK